MKAELVRIIVGLLLIVLGLVPGLLHKIREGVQEGIQTFSKSFRSPFVPVVAQHEVKKHENIERSVSLALVGVAMILLGLLSYFSKLAQ